MKFKELRVFEELKKKKSINYDDIPVKFKAWKTKMGYTNAQCAKILDVSIPTVKRLLKGKTKFTELYERLKELNLL